MRSIQSQVKSDNRGDLAKKAPIETIRPILAPPKATFVLTGDTKDGGGFSAEDAVIVKPQRRPFCPTGQQRRSLRRAAVRLCALFPLQAVASPDR